MVACKKAVKSAKAVKAVKSVKVESDDDELLQVKRERAARADAAEALPLMERRRREEKKMDGTLWKLAQAMKLLSEVNGELEGWKGAWARRFNRWKERSSRSASWGATHKAFDDYHSSLCVMHCDLVDIKRS